MTAAEPHQMFDDALRVRRLDRAARLGFASGGDFLHREVAAEIADRVSDVTRSFADIGIAGTGGGAYAAALEPMSSRIGQVDASSEMARLASIAVPNAKTRAEPLDPLPLAEGSLDLAISGLWMHAANDPVGHLVQMRRALRPDGLMLAALLGGRTLAELRACLAEAEVAVTGGLSPRVAPMGEIRDLGALLQRAGLAMPVADGMQINTTYASALHLMRDLRLMGETNTMLDRRRVAMRRDVLLRTAALYAEKFGTPDGRIRATFEIIFLTGWAPAENQPVPKRPGSATARLADALGTAEKSAGEKAGK